MHEQSRKVTLPGLMYERAGQWWWQVRLPGEETVKTRLLEIPGVGTAGCDPETAERAALALWEQAVVREGTRQFILDCTRKVEQFKTRFLDKLGRLTEIVESATAKAQAEAHARTEIESRLNAIIAAAGLRLEDTGPRTASPTSDAWDSLTDPPAAPRSPAPAENDPAQSEVRLCECCGRTSVPTADLKQIDSGQWLCTDCLNVLRIDGLQAELDALTKDLA